MITNKQVIGIALIVVLLVLLGLILLNFQKVSWANQELKRIAFEETNGLEDDQNKAIALARWIRGNLKPESSEKNPEMVFLTGSGDCIGLSEVFVLMANSIGLPARLVQTRGERHAWTEFFTEGEWLNIDPFNDVNGNSVGNFDFYDTWDQPFGKRFSYVYYKDGAGNWQDVTEKYTETGNLIVKITENNNPAIARVFVKSHHLIELDSNTYKYPDISFFATTNSSGILEKNIGGNNYTIVVEKDLLPFLPPIIVLKSQKEISISKNSEKIVNFDLSDGFGLDFAELWLDNTLVISMFLLIIYLIYLIFQIMLFVKNIFFTRKKRMVEK